MKSNSFNSVAQIITDNGWLPHPINGKVPVVSSWPEYAKNHESAPLSDWIIKYPNLNTGLLFNGTYFAIDVDVYDEDISTALGKKLHVMFGNNNLVLRIGKHPKFMVFFKPEKGEQVTSRKYHPVTGNKPIIEVFASSGQVAGFGIHPDTGVCYAWSDRNPLTIRPDELPTMTLSQLNEFLYEVNKYIPLKDYSPVAIDKPEPNAFYDANNILKITRPTHKTPESPENIARVNSALKALHSDSRHDWVLRGILMCLLPSLRNNHLIRKIVDRWF